MMQDGTGEIRGGDDSTGGAVEDAPWVVAKSLLEANDATTATLEAFLLYETTDRLDDLSTEEMAARLDEVIERQHRAIEGLELAREAFEELDDE